MLICEIPVLLRTHTSDKMHSCHSSLAQQHAETIFRGQYIKDSLKNLGNYVNQKYTA